MKLRIIPIILFIAAIGLVLYAYPIIKNRYFQTAENSGQKPSGSSDNGALPDTPTSAEADENNLPGDEEAATPEQAPVQTKNVLEIITGADCDSECKNFQADKLEYCNEVCGLKTADPNAADCENLTGIKKDYCFKDLGITKRDAGLCENISDSNIRSACKNRILEDNVDEIMQNRDLPS